MAEDGSTDRDRTPFEELQYELTRHLERAEELAARAQASNDVVQLEIERAREIVNRLRGVSSDEGRS